MSERTASGSSRSSPAHLSELTEEQRVKALSKEVGRLIAEEGASGAARVFATLISALEGVSRRLASHEYAIRMLGLPIIDDVAKNLELPREVSIGADWAFSEADGFHGIEYTRDGIPFRWTGPGAHFRITLYVDRQSAKHAEFLLLPFEGPARSVARALSVTIDNTTVLPSFEEGEEFDCISFELPQRAGRGATTISCKQTLWSPKDSGSDDQRILGVAMRRFIVRAS